MGLDVYLYHCRDRKAAFAAEQRAEDAVNKIWDSVGKKYQDLSEAEKDDIQARSLIAQEIEGCDGSSQHKSVTEIRRDSEQYPNHLFKIGYFRSSYNESGLNRAMKKLGLPDLYEIMNNPSRATEVHHDWADCLKRVNKVISKYQKHLSSEVDGFYISEVRRPSGNGGADSAEAAWKIFRSEHERNKESPSFVSYSSSFGEFYHQGVKIHAIIPSSDQYTLSYLICAKENKYEEDWYLTSLKIVRETCEYVLSQEDPQNYYMHWSG